jgi:hypothetical protein
MASKNQQEQKQLSEDWKVADLVRTLLEYDIDAPLGLAAGPRSNIKILSVYKDDHGKVWIDIG